MEWSGTDTVKLLDMIFSVADTARALERLNCCYIGSDGVHFTGAGHGYFCFPHVIEALARIFHKPKTFCRKFAATHIFSVVYDFALVF